MWNLFKVNNKDTRTKSLTSCLVPLFLTSIRFYLFHWCFHSWLWTSECQLSRKMTSLWYPHCWIWTPAGIYLLKVNNRNSRTRCEICWKLTIKTPERRPWSRSGVFIVNFQHISHLVLVFLLLTLNMQLSAGNATPIYCFAIYLMYFWIWKTLLSISVKAFTDDDYVFDQNITNSIQTFLNLKLL